MSNDNAFLELVNELISLTESGALEWESTASEDIYLAGRTAKGRVLTFKIGREKRTVLVGPETISDRAQQSAFGSTRREVWHYSLTITDRTSGDNEVTTVGSSEIGDVEPLQRLFELAGRGPKQTRVERILEALRK